MIIIPDAELNKKRKNDRKGQPVRPPRSVEVNYRNALYDITDLLNNRTKELMRLIDAGVPKPEIFDVLAGYIRSSEEEAAREADRIATQFLEQAAIKNKERFENMLKTALNVDFLTTVSGERTKVALAGAKVTNVGLIKSIPSQHWDKVLDAVNQNFAGTLEGSLQSRLRSLGPISKRRAKLIARDQTSKATGQLNAARQLDAGIKKYIWRTSDDERVVGNPFGKYPKGNRKHNDHFIRNGQTFEWSKPPQDGHPGDAIQCRCAAIPLISLDELDTL